MQTVRPALSPEYIWFTILFNLTVQTSLLAWYQLRPNLFVLILLVLWNLLLFLYFTKALNQSLRSMNIPAWQRGICHFLAMTPYLGAALILLLMMKDPLKRHPHFLRGFFWVMCLSVVLIFPNSKKESTFPPYLSATDLKIITHAPHSLGYLYLSWREGQGQREGQAERRETASIEHTHTLWGLNKLLQAKAELDPEYPKKVLPYLKQKPLSTWPLPLGTALLRGSIGHSLHLFARHFYLKATEVEQHQ